MVDLTNRPTENPYEGLSLDHLFDMREQLKSEIKEIQKLVKNAEAAIEERVQEAVQHKRNQFEKETGRVEVAVDGVVVIHDVPKRVEWLQEDLRQVAHELKALGHNPDDIIKEVLTVNENVYKNLPEKMRWILNQARVVKHGKTTITMKELS